jgi:serine/threonine protein kinase
VCIVKIQEVYVGNDLIHLVTPSLKATHRPLSDLSFLPSEAQVIQILEKLLSLCHEIHGRNQTIGNLHPSNIFIDEDNPDDVLVTDVGFAYMTGMEPETKMQIEFSAPEVRGKCGVEIEKAVHEFPHQCDLYSMGAIAKFLLFGATHYVADDC